MKTWAKGLIAAVWCSAATVGLASAQSQPVLNTRDKSAQCQSIDNWIAIARELGGPKVMTGNMVMAAERRATAPAFADDVFPLYFGKPFFSLSRNDKRTIDNALKRCSQRGARYWYGTAGLAEAFQTRSNAVGLEVQAWYDEIRKYPSGLEVLEAKRGEYAPVAVARQAQSSTPVTTAPRVFTVSDIQIANMKRAAAANRPLQPGGRHRIVAQNAGEMIFEDDQFSIHLKDNFVLASNDRTGPSHCLQAIGADAAHMNLVVILKVARSETITRRWLWSNVRPVLVNHIKPAICPDATSIGANIYVEGFDTVEEGFWYAVSDRELPIIEVPANNFNDPLPSRKFDQIVGKFVSRGVIHMRLQLDYCPDQEFDGFRGFNCDFESFEPRYWGVQGMPLTSDPSGGARRRAGRDNLSVADHLDRIYLENIEPRSSFDHYAAFKRDDYLMFQGIRQRAAAAIETRAQINRIMEAIDENFWELMIAGLADRPYSQSDCLRMQLDPPASGYPMVCSDILSGD